MEITFVMVYAQSNLEQVRKYVEEYINRNNFGVSKIKVENYVDNQIKAVFSINTEDVKIEQCIYNVLVYANTMFSTSHKNANWIFKGPHSEGTLFECILNVNTDMYPLQWAHIMLGN